MSLKQFIDQKRQALQEECRGYMQQSETQSPHDADNALERQGQLAGAQRELVLLEQIEALVPEEGAPPEAHMPAHNPNDPTGDDAVLRGLVKKLHALEDEVGGMQTWIRKVVQAAVE